MKTDLRGGIVRAVGIALAGALAIAGGAGAAQAADGKPVIDPAKTGSITVHKYEYPDELPGLPADGMKQTIPSGITPLADVTFTVQQVADYDLTTNAGWVALEGLTPARAVDGTHTLVDYAAQTTPASGEVTFWNLPVGVYLVTETVWPAGATPVDPFLITVPMTNPTNQAEWIYDVHVYPKNPVTTATKTVDDGAAVKLGDPVTFTIEGDIPEAEVIDGYKIVDTLDPMLTYTGAVVTLLDGTTLVAGDYDLDHTNGVVTVEFTEAGRIKLAAHSETKVKVVITATVNAVGEIANQAVVYPNLPSFDIEPGEPGGPAVTPEVETKWGAIDLLKVNARDERLGGAQFSVYLSEADAKSNTNPVKIGDHTVFKTNGDGELRISGLRYSDFADGKDLQPSDALYRTYWLAEVEAPEGYELLAHPIEFVVTAETTELGIDTTIENVPSNGGFDLPLTGGMGTVAITAAGGLLIAGAVLLAVRNRRRETAHS